MRNLFFCFGILMFLTACNNSQVTAQDSPKMTNYEVLYLSEYGGSGEETTRIIDNQADFAQFWSEVTFQPALSAAKFDSDKKMVLVKNFQSRNSGGNTYEIQSVSQEGNKIEVNYKVTSPDGMATMAITNPLMIILVDKVEKPSIEFIKK